ncbi:hypothetical protein [Novosphingobium sp. fls2-241-R2A-195]|uniref:hypothetical protein n=1 Tax=Novosphingobium sp. fls2-241-R2A-195 TaxID=3040296 RepID=UPI00255156BA|nr:hypothetical protein [Novosphingobium sp. fls2-241-R2A-195]
MSHPLSRARHIRVPAFAPVPVRPRKDGWTPARQAAFLGALAQGGGVEAAARRVGLSRESAYRLRTKPGAGSFAAAWDKVTGKPPVKRKVTPEERAVRARFGLLKVRMYGGRHVATELKPDNRALLSFLAQLDRAGGGDGPGA